MKVDGKTIGDERQFTIEEQFHDWFHEGLSAEDVSTKIKSMYEDYCVWKEAKQKAFGESFKKLDQE
jgi:hypothetical protein|tara:strand:+ start:1285 stop:1482 length:198 start_codon:yes stop_codon:yes gene_type:complete